MKPDTARTETPTEVAQRETRSIVCAIHTLGNDATLAAIAIATGLEPSHLLRRLHASGPRMFQIALRFYVWRGNAWGLTARGLAVASEVKEAA